MPGLQGYDARRIIDLQHYAYMMEKHQRGCANDPFEPIRRLAMSESRSRNPDKPLTSFRISDILSAERETCKQRRKSDSSQEGTPEDYRLKTLDASNEKCTPPKRLRVANVELEHGNRSDNDRDEHSPRLIVRPWNVSSRISPEKNEIRVKNHRHKDPKRSITNRSVSPESSSNSANSLHSLSSDEYRKLDPASKLFKQSPTLCHTERHECDESGDEEEIDVEACEEEDSDVSVKRTDKGDISPLDALVAMSSKTFMGLESFGKNIIFVIIFY